jgi:acetyl-CoA carboxylase biotin carboxylase subunit
MARFTLIRDQSPITNHQSQSIMKKILIANRGEIALRVMRSAKKMGIKTVAVYSEADRNAMHVKFADEAVLLGAAPSSESYLVMDKVLEAAKTTGADGIHPGYGFLSENAVFAQMVEDAGMTFIGPRPHAIRVMGDKLQAKETVKGYNIPMVPGIDEAVTDVEIAKEIALQVGFPILIKAAAGGGGKGMRVVQNVEELPEQMKRAISEAVSAFGNGAVFVEKYVTSPRHIEIQVLADTHGNVVHLFERECSVQRRHQKVVEEAPSAVLTPAIRKAMGQAAVDVAKACDYVGAGTVEFLLDGDLNFYFLEMNTRLQVEHPVSELITGIDLVEQQIKVARGEKLAFTQEDLTITGHALEVRVYAEDPLENFSPNVGTLTTYQRPTGKGVRLDDGYEQGMEIPIYYDPMIAKLITYGDSREEAIHLMKKAIQDYKIEHESFTSGNFDTHFVKDYYSPEALKAQQNEEKAIAAAVGLKLYLESQKELKVVEQGENSWMANRL